MAIEIVETRPDHPDATALINELEASLALRYPAASRHGYSVDKLLLEGVSFFVMRHDGIPCGCGGMQFYDGAYGELKRMYIRPQFRGLGLGKRLLSHLADFSLQRGIKVLRLETGVHQVEAIALYEGFGFQRIPPFGVYQPDPLSVCFEKHL